MLIQPRILVVFSLGAVLTAQTTRNHDVPLKNWAAPLYWQPSQAESATARGNLDAAVRPASPGASTLPPALVFVAMTPCRVVDTRGCILNPALCTNATFGPPSLSPNVPRPFPIQSSPTCTIPAAAQAYSFNVTVIPTPLGTPVGFLTIWPQGLSQPNAVTLDDYPTGDIRNNAAIVPAGTPSGGVSVIANAATDLVIDINGYFAAPTDVNSNTGLGLNALSSNTTGYSNTAVGASALASNSTGIANAADGYQALFSNTEGAGNTGIGSQALYHNVSGSANTAVGDSALINNTASNNTALGYAALYTNVGGTSNTATGFSTLYNNTSGNDNTASGYTALTGNTTGSNNTASGSHALNNNSTGANNTAAGLSALYNNLNGNDNTASGYTALTSNTTGVDNTASGSQALNNNSSGSFNTASGFQALFSNNTANYNTADGYQALYNATGNTNTAGGAYALFHDTNGSSNTALGYQALVNNVGGGNNIAIGANAGANITALSSNIDIGNTGLSTDIGAIRIGTAANHSSFFAAGISGATAPSGVFVLIGTGGQLGTVNSSRRYKEDIQDMDDASSGLLRLRPVTYRYQMPYSDGSKPIDYGLIAEEVAEVYPDLVVKNADGQIETVQYHKLIPMLLNELQKQSREQRDQNESLQAQVAALQKALETLMAGGR